MPDIEDARIESIYVYVGEKVRSARVAAGMSQDVLAQKVGVTRSSIANFEAGRQRIALHLFVAVCQVLHMDTCELLPENPEPHRSNVSTDIEEQLASSPESMQRFVQETVAVARKETDSTTKEH